MDTVASTISWLYKVSRIMSEAEICEDASAIGPTNLSSSRHHEPPFFFFQEH